MRDTGSMQFHSIPLHAVGVGRVLHHRGRGEQRTIDSNCPLGQDLRIAAHDVFSAHLICYHDHHRFDGNVLFGLAGDWYHKEQFELCAFPLRVWDHYHDRVPTERSPGAFGELLDTGTYPLHRIFVTHPLHGRRAHGIRAYVEGQNLQFPPAR